MSRSRNADMKCVQVSLIAPIDDPKLVLFIYRATGFLEVLSQSTIVHAGIFGFSDEKQNIQVEKVFEAAAAKGFRPCTSVPLHFPPTHIQTKMNEQVTYVGTLRSGLQDDERYQPECRLPLKRLRTIPRGAACVRSC